MNSPQPELRIGLFLLLATLGAAYPVRAGGPPVEPFTCTDEIKETCSGLEEHLETCLDQRGSLLSAKCGQLLEQSIELSRKKPDGSSACVKDIRAQCPHLSGQPLMRCIVDKKDTFSSACRDYLADVAQAVSPNLPPTPSPLPQ